MCFCLRNHWPRSNRQKTVEIFQMLALMDSFYLPGQKEMSLNTEGTGHRASGLHSVVLLIVCVMWGNNCLLSKMKHLNVLPLDRGAGEEGTRLRHNEQLLKGYWFSFSFLYLALCCIVFAEHSHCLSDTLVHSLITDYFESSCWKQSGLLVQ